MKILALAAASVVALGACATSEHSTKSYTPQVDVIVKAPKVRTAQANYQMSPEETALIGAGGSAK
jgi:hypothetical protein